MRYSQWKLLPAANKGQLPLSILAARGIESDIDIRRFLRSPLSSLHDPFLLPDMRNAVERLEKALETGEKIAVYGDYDVDGITATCLLTDYLRSKNADCVYFIPNRSDDGYGLHAPVIRELKASGVTLIVTVDVGIMAFEAALVAKDEGVDLIVTDHHNCPETLPMVLAAVNPRRADSLYPYGRLAGVGVAFKLVCALELGSAYNNIEGLKALIRRYGDLVALGTVADIMPLDGENRVLTAHGIYMLSSSPRPGIRILLEALGLNGKPITAQTIGYHIAPVLNAAGRMKSAGLALELLLAGDAARAQYLVAVLIEANTQRRKLEAEIYARAAAECEKLPSDVPAITLAHEDWHQGVTGIVASKLLEKYRKPVFIISVNGETGKGTARCPRGTDLMELLGRCSEFLISFGGHSLAAGFSVKAEDTEAFKFAVQNAAQGLEREPETETLIIDAAVGSNDLTVDNAEGIATLGPFGSANPEPVLMLNRAVINQITPLKDGKHLRLLISADGAAHTVICFGFAHGEFLFRAGDIVDIAFSLSVNRFRGEVTPQLELKDIRSGDSA